MIVRPFICYYGAKWLAAPRYPQPLHDTIIEPFAGAAGYSLRYPDHKVILYDVDPIIVGLWRYLITAPESDILNIPIVTHTDDLPSSLCEEAKWLVGFWMNPGSSRPKHQRGTWKSDKVNSDIRYWSPLIRERIASQQQYIRHWIIQMRSFIDADDYRGTWFIDPPYQRQGRHYTHTLTDDDYVTLGAFCHAVRGQVIVCEQMGATWLPFQYFRLSKSARTRVQPEAIWVKDNLS